MSPVRTAIVGLGYWGPNVLRNFAAQDDCEVAWACDLKEENVHRTKSWYPAVATTTQYEDLLQDPALKLIILATPTSTHANLALRALGAGKHVFIEKPMASTAEEARTITAAAKRAGCQVFVDHTFIFAPAVQRLAALAHEGKLGDLLYFDSVRINLGIIQKDCNVLWDLAIHDLSILSTFTDLTEVTAVTAHGSAHFGSQVENAHLHLRYRSGFSAHIHVGWLSPAKIRQTVLAGSRAMVTYDDTQPSEKLRIYDKGVERDASKPDPFFPKYRAGDIVIPALSLTETLALEARHVLRCVRGEETPKASGRDGCNVLTILEAADASLRQGGAPVPL